MLDQKPWGILIPHPTKRVDPEVSVHFATDYIMTIVITENTANAANIGRPDTIFYENNLLYWKT